MKISPPSTEWRHTRWTVRRLAVASVIAAASLAVGVVGGPGLAFAQQGTPSPAASGQVAAPGKDRRLPPAARGPKHKERVLDRLAPLVASGTITQSQADKVAAALSAGEVPARRPGSHQGPGAGAGAGPGSLIFARSEAVAEALGVSVEQLRVSRRSGTSLAELAASRGISTDLLVQRLVAAAQFELAAAVKAGRLTQARADKVAATLTERVTAQVSVASRGRGEAARDKDGRDKDSRAKDDPRG